MKKLFSISKKKTTSSPPKAILSLEKLQETLETLEKKEQLLQKKISNEVKKAKDYTNQKNKNAAIQCLKKKKLYEAQIEQIANLQLRIHDQMLTLQGATSTTETIDALRKGSNAVKSIQQSLDVDDISKTIEEASEQSENMKQLQDALANSIGVADDFDEDELEAELEELEEAELEEQILKQNSTATTQPSSMATTTSPEKETRKPANNVDDLADRQAEMAI